MTSLVAVQCDVSCLIRRVTVQRDIGFVTRLATVQCDVSCYQVSLCKPSTVARSVFPLKNTAEKPRFSAPVSSLMMG